MIKHPFRFKPFQREDLARGALHPGLILAWATGLGKTIAMFIWPLLKVGFLKPTRTNRLVPKQPVLLVVPGDGHEQTDDESRKHFKTLAVRLDSQATFLRLSQVNPQTGRRELPPGYYLTSYTQLSQNGVAEFPELKGSAASLMHQLFLNDDHVREWWEARADHHGPFYERLGVTPDSTWNEIVAAHAKLTAGRMESERFPLDNAKQWLENITPRGGYVGWPMLDPSQREHCRMQLVRQRHKQYAAGIGESRHGIKCVYSASLSDLAQDSFGGIVVDEGTKLQGEETLISLGCRQIRAAHRLVLSATPIKNRFPQVFRLAHFACGGHEHPTARFPYGSTTCDRDDFAQEFQVGETSKEKKNARRKLTPQVANIHRAWKLFAPVILRRRKEDCAEDIVPKRRHVIRVPMGTLQAQVYDFHMRAEYQMTDARGRTRPNVGARLQALRIAAANPKSALLKRPANDIKTVGKVFSPYNYIPKVASILHVIEQVLVRREQIMVGSAFQNSLDALSERLCEAGVPHLLLDGRTTQKHRGVLAREFKVGSPRAVLEGLTERHSPFPVVLAGVESMAELHSFPYCNNVGLVSYSWAYDKFEQFINRVHRINSPWAVDVWSVICDGSIDRVLEDSVHTKGDASDLVLDGHLLGENPSEVNLHELLSIAMKDFKRNAKTIDEPSLEKDWPRLRLALAKAFKNWSALCRGDLLDRKTERLPTPPPTPLIGMAKMEVRVDDLPLWRQRRVRKSGA